MLLGPLMVDVVGTQLQQQDINLLLEPAVGAVILFSRNYESRTQVAELIKEIKALRNPSLLMAVDQEGGRVQRFRNGFFNLPAVHKLGQHYEIDPKHGLLLSESAGTVMAMELLQTGIDFSFAPVLDRANLESKVIGDRGFHHTPEILTELADAFISGMNKAGMAATGKHFPGHGGVMEDSHFDLPVDRRSLDELKVCDLIPFEKLASKLGGIMTAHVDFPNIDNQLPTFSKFWLETILRKKLGFNGLIFSDDLTMKGADAGGTDYQKTQKALAAGCDMALICNAPEIAKEVAQQLGGSIRPNQVRYETMRGNFANSGCDLDAAKSHLSLPYRS